MLFDNLNVNATDPLIRTWVLSEEQIASPPTTRAEAEAIANYVTYPSLQYEFRREPGTYFVVASNETHFQSLAADDAFEAGVDFSLLEVEVGEEKARVTGINTNTPTILPDLNEIDF
ncbi:MAG: hypothetical protein AAFV88_02290 [Planctomycetota bacterium]